MNADDRLTRLNGLAIAAGEAVVYWMQRSQRSTSNLALNEAIQRAKVLHRPVVCYFALDDSYPQTTARDYRFMLEGLQNVARGMQERRVGFVVRREGAVRGIVQLALEVKACLVVTDESQLRLGRKRREQAALLLNKAGIPLWSVDNDLVVPVRALQREHYAARTIRPHINRLRDQFLHPISNPLASVAPPALPNNPDLSDLTLTLSKLNVDQRLRRSALYTGGEIAARDQLQHFTNELLSRYDKQRNDASVDVTSNLSPYFHFGQLDPWTAALCVAQADAPQSARDSFLEELLVRRELASNFTYFNPRYDTLAALPEWARATLEQHVSDRREQIYTYDEMAAARTGDDLWNAGQQELVLTGTMHGWVRMYWGKRILEWTQSPAQGLDHTLRLNNGFSLDGRDPVSFANVLWCYGKHDRPWGRRPIFGTVRSMTRAGAERKFDVGAYIRRIRKLAETNPDISINFPA